MHPQLVSSAYSDIQLFKSLFGESYYIGEVGLDFSKEYVQTRKAQIEIFTEIIRFSFIFFQNINHRICRFK